MQGAHTTPPANRFVVTGVGCVEGPAEPLAAALQRRHLRGRAASRHAEAVPGVFAGVFGVLRGRRRSSYGGGGGVPNGWCTESSTAGEEACIYTYICIHTTTAFSVTMSSFSTVNLNEALWKDSKTTFA